MTSSPQTTPPPPSLMNLPEGLTPDSIDTLTILSSILARLQTPSGTSNLTASTAGSPPAATPAQLSTEGPLTTKDIPAATDGLKHNLQKARVLVKDLPDVERSIKEQEAEIRGLEEKIRAQKGILEQLMGVGVSIKRDREQREKDRGADVMET
ncbi:hypothetical protein PZA11_005068 [Diplocarpon coronariae]|uniref:Mediator of RNA polymerase II transcription subunit 9 n=1 Tax=Diplocarpon coronariae TaxID=2795749 RepID=A0A218YTC8_9HELO|nr:hypothetical protein JHW43_009040 [Diplocarpon mali]OWO97965.1 hypothetical protein B2J93_3763 [Marssonina coronariae]